MEHSTQMKDEKLIKFNAFRQLCLSNAEAALKSAEHLLGNNANHIVFHLSLLALEEVGQIFMSWIQLHHKEIWGRENAKIAMDDHTKKLFYAIWGPSIGNELVTKSQLGDNQFMASTLHKKRIESLYGDISDTIESSLKIIDEEVQSIISFTKARLELAKIDGEVKEDIEANPNMEWLAKFMEISGKRDYVFGKEAQENLIKLGNVNEWIQWLKTSFEEEQNTLQTLAEKELNRNIVTDVDKVEPKWEITFTIFTPSHSIRANILAAVNKLDRPIKLFPGKDKHTLIIKNIQGSNLPVKDLWYQGWLSCKLFVAALNIGANGIFYWNIPLDVSKYYDYITDLETKSKLTVQLETHLTFNWKEKKLFLTEQNLQLAFMVYEELIMLKSAKEAKPITDYLAGLGMLAKTDIHLRLEASALSLFYQAFYDAIKIYEPPNLKLDILETGYLQIEKMLTGRQEFDRTIKIMRELQEEKALSQRISLREVVAMKRYCEIYFLTIAARKLHKDNSLKLCPMLKGERTTLTVPKTK